MEPMSLHILGCGSAKPSNGHLPSSQVLNARGKLFMIDCGEGAQMQWNGMRLGMARLNNIFITHAHGDHCFGLPGLISTMGLLGRTSDLHIYGPEGLRPLVDCTLQHFCEGMTYQVFFHAVDTTRHQMIMEDRSIEVWSLPLVHRVPCCGYLFREKPTLPHIRPEMIQAFGIPVSQVNNIKAGADWVEEDGNVIPNSRLVTPPDPPRAFAYCSDTQFQPRLAEWTKGVDLLYHEATFNDENELRARQTCHSTARQAATIAHKAQVRKLCIGHYSGRIKDEAALLGEARQVFENTILAREHMTVEI